MNAFRESLARGPLRIVAHRGDSMHAPENTLEAARRGHSAGAFAWELDVHLSRDGEPVVIHDSSLARTTDVARRFAGDERARSGFLVSDFTTAEIRSLDAGSWFVDPAGGHRSARAFGTLDALGADDRRAFGSGAIRVPTLIEALELTRDLGWLVNVEMKSVPSSDPALLPAVLEVVGRAEMADRVLISSFDHDDLAAVARLEPGIATGVLCDTPLHRPSTYVRDVVGADFYHPSSAACGAGSLAYRRSPLGGSLRPLDPGVPTLVYTVNCPRLAEHFGEAGASAVFTDDPSSLARHLGDPGARQSVGSSRRAHQTPFG